MSKRKMIMDSFDVKCLKSHIKLLFGVYVCILSFIIIFGIIVFWGYTDEMIKAVLVYSIIYSCGYIPAIVVPILKINKLLKRSDKLEFYDTILRTPCKSGRKFYFSLSFLNNQGNTVYVNTDSIFTSEMNYRNFNKWMNCTVIVAYDKELRNVIVVQKKS